jgi:hypothetical protein
MTHDETAARAMRLAAAATTAWLEGEHDAYRSLVSGRETHIVPAMTAICATALRELEEGCAEWNARDALLAIAIR